MDRDRAEIHLISDGKMGLSQFVEQAAAVHPLLDYIHLREKQRPACELMAALKQMLEGGIPAAKLVINDRVDVALAAGIGGVQLAWHSLETSVARMLAPQLRLGRSVHSPVEAAEAGRQGADYCLYGHIYPSASKRGLPERGLKLLAEVVCRSPVPVIAIGGIKPGHAVEVIKSGAVGIAVMSGICGAKDPVAAAYAYREAVDSH